MVICTQLQAFMYIITLVRTVVCLEMYNSMNCISYICHNIYIQRLVLKYTIMKSFKLVDQQGPPDVYIADYGWKIDDGILCPSTDSGPPGPPLLVNVISCRCRAKDKACKEGNFSCYREKLSCTIYCICTAGDECCNPFTKKEEMEKNDDQHDHDYNDDCVDRDEL